MRILIMLAAVAVVINLLSCGASIQTADVADIALNSITDTAQPVYSMAQSLCSSKEWAVVHSERPAVQKAAAVSKIRIRCDAVFKLFERIIELQKETRSIVDAARTGTGDAAAALGRVQEIQKLLTAALERFESMKDLK